MIVRKTCGLLIVSLSALFAGTTLANDDAQACKARAGSWLDPASGETVAAEQLFTRLARARVVLLGEEHTAVEHHRWQGYVLAGLHARNSNMVVGFEMLPRRAQSVLDAWSAGTLSEEALLERSDWARVWGYDADLYLPLLHFARLNRLPALALNVDRELVSLVGSKGWRALTVAQRGGLSDPAPASKAYSTSLARLYALKQTANPEHGFAHGGEPGNETLAQIQDSAAFKNFVDAQLVWDRAMAEILAAAHRRDPGALVVGIVGRGHLEYGYGIPRQLADLGITDVAVALPVSAAGTCEGVEPGLATALFLLGDDGDVPAAAGKPRLGVIIETAEAGVRVLKVAAGSVAEATGVIAGDLIVAAAGFTTGSSAELIEVVSRQAPGTWLPLRIERDGEVRELIARFPQRFTATQ